MDARVSRHLIALAIAAALAAGGATGAVGSPVAQASADLPWKDQVLAVVQPLAERRLSAGDGPGSPFLALGLDALGRASGDERYATAIAQGATPAPARPDGDAICVADGCRADTLLGDPDLWTGSSDSDATRATAVALDPPFRRMADTLFDRQVLLFRADTATPVEGRFDAHLNARAFVALTRMIDALPPEDPARLEYVAWYREMARPIVRVQGPDGWWRETLGDPAAPIDRSASALYVHGLTWGLNTGMLSFNEGETAALRGWDALRSPDGLAALQSDDEGLGALLLASAQLAERRW